MHTRSLHYCWAAFASDSICGPAETLQHSLQEVEAGKQSLQDNVQALGGLKAQLPELQDKLAALQQEKESAALTIAGQDKLLEELQVEIARLTALHAMATKDLDLKDSAIPELEQTIAQLKADLDEVGADLTACQGMAQTNSTQARQKQSETAERMTQLEELNGQLLKELDASQAKVSCANEEAQALQSRLVQAEGELKATDGGVQGAKAALQENAAELEASQAECLAKQKQLDDLEATLVEARALQRTRTPIAAVR